MNKNFWKGAMSAKADRLIKISETWRGYITVVPEDSYNLPSTVFRIDLSCPQWPGRFHLTDENHLKLTTTYNNNTLVFHQSVA